MNSIERCKGWGPWKQIWASICSIHQIHQEDCIDCNIGIWTNYWKQQIISFLFIYCPRIYLWLMSK